MDKHCSEEILSSYLDGDLESEIAGRTAEHLAECEVCRCALAQVRAVRDGAQDMEQFVPPDRVWGAIQERTRAPKRRIRRAARLFWFGAPALAAALMLVVLAGRTHLKATSGSVVPRVASGLGQDRTAIEAACEYGEYVRGIDHAIQECRAALDENPGNLRVRSAYQGATAGRARAIDRLTSGKY